MKRLRLVILGGVAALLVTTSPVDAGSADARRAGAATRSIDLDGPVTPGVPPVRSPVSRLRERLRIGTSAAGRPIFAERYGTPGGVVVLVAAAIHGNEVSGRQIARAVADEARAGRMPRGVDLWVIRTVNPDGVAAGTRQNGRGVDLNRNFPTGWTPLTCPGRYCSGPTPASEPETAALIDFLRLTRPRVAVWWHSTGRIVDTPRPGVARPAVLTAYALATGYPVGEVGCGGRPCSGTATQFGNATLRGASHFVVELPVDAEVLSAAEVSRHVAAVWAAARAAR